MKTRNSNLEILRIFSMLFIILHHFSLHGFMISKELPFTYNIIYLKSLIILGKIGVNIFIIISSYFLLNKGTKFNKLLKIYGEVIFYSLSIFLVVLIFNKESITFTNIVMSFLPISTSHYWFVTDYIILIILSPYLNVFIKNTTQKKYKELLIVLLSIVVVINGSIDKLFSDFSNNLIWFISLYLITGYIKKYNILKKDSQRKRIIISTISFMTYILSVVAFIFLGKHFNNFKLINNAALFAKQNSIFSLVISFELFYIFLNYKQFNNKIINIISSTTFGVYILHENVFMRTIIWDKIFNCQSYLYNRYLIAYSIIITIIIFFVFSLIDYIRQLTIEKYYMKIIKKIE